MYSFGTDESIDRLVETYSPTLLRIALTRLHSTADAEDAVQDVFLRFLTAHPVFRDREHEKAWLIRATLNRAADFCRQAERRALPLDGAPEIAAAEPPDSGLLSAVQALPPAYSAVIHLYYYEGYSIKEISNILALPAPTVGTRLARGRKRLRELLKEELV